MVKDEFHPNFHVPTLFNEKMKKKKLKAMVRANL